LSQPGRAAVATERVRQRDRHAHDRDGDAEPLVELDRVGVVPLFECSTQPVDAVTYRRERR
jgi:hypothetical protein